MPYGIFRKTSAFMTCPVFTVIMLLEYHCHSTNTRHAGHKGAHCYTNEHMFFVCDRTVSKRKRLNVVCVNDCDAVLIGRFNLLEHRIS